MKTFLLWAILLAQTLTILSAWGIINITTEGIRKIMATLAEVQAKVAAEDTVIDSAIALIQGLAAQIAALAPNQAAIDALATEIQGKSDALAAAVAANTHQSPPPPAPAP